VKFTPLDQALNGASATVRCRHWRTIRAAQLSVVRAATIGSRLGLTTPAFVT